MVSSAARGTASHTLRIGAFSPHHPEVKFLADSTSFSRNAVEVGYISRLLLLSLGWGLSLPSCSLLPVSRSVAREPRRRRHSENVAIRTDLLSMLVRARSVPFPCFFLLGRKNGLLRRPVAGACGCGGKFANVSGAAGWRQQNTRELFSQGQASYI